MRSSLVLKSKRFREERQADWKEMERLLSRIEASSVRGLTDEEFLLRAQPHWTKA